MYAKSGMSKIEFTETEIAYILHILARHYLSDDDIRKVIRLIVSHLPVAFDEPI